jgi:hypothetical protein
MAASNRDQKTANHMNKNSTASSGFFTTRLLLGLTLSIIGISLGAFLIAAPSQPIKPSPNAAFKPTVIYSNYNGVSPRLRDLPTQMGERNGTWVLDRPRPIRPPGPPAKLPVVDRVQQTAMSALTMPPPLQTFEGMDQADGCGNCIPPDPNGAVGPNHYVQMVNSSYSVYNKTGTRLVGPIHINQLWANLPGQCQVDNDGDPIALYDHLADRWLLSQFAVNGGNGPFAQCVAISTSPDPTGTYYVYEFDQTDFNDYPHFGIWPDAYYMTAHIFGGAANTYLGQGVYAFQRARMLNGQPAALVFFNLGNVDTTFGGQLPSNVDGAPPPAGSPNYFAEVDSQINSPSLGPDAMRIWQFHVDWTTPSNSTFGINGQPNSVLPVAMWTPSQCVYGVGTCVPQLASPYQLDVIGDRLMHRIAYRNFGDHEALVINHSVIADARIGVRWYEVRSPGSSPVIYQQSTFAPIDQLYRWMGSIAMDRLGDIAVGYSTSSPADHPSIAYAGRLATDPLNQLSQGETQMWAGLGSENVAFYVPPEGRWGDYSSLTVDPTDNCTFWYVNEYFAVGAEQDPGAPWKTRIGSFKFPNCAASPVQLTSVVSRKTHGAAGTFEVNLPSSGNPGIECRTGGAGGNHTIVFRFQNTITSVANASVTAGTGSVSSSAIGADPHEYVVNLSGVANAQTITVTLTNVYDSAGNSSPSVSVQAGFLIGDVNANRTVNAADIASVKSQTGNPVTAANFRDDVTADGSLNATDISLTKSRSGTGLP